MRLEWLLIATTPLLVGHTNITIWLANPNHGHSHFPNDSGSYYKHLVLHYQSEDSCAHSMCHIDPPPGPNYVD
jgi:hypothetical protein